MRPPKGGHARTADSALPRWWQNNCLVTLSWIQGFTAVLALVALGFGIAALVGVNHIYKS